MFLRSNYVMKFWIWKGRGGWILMVQRWYQRRTRCRYENSFLTLWFLFLKWKSMCLTSFWTSSQKTNLFEKMCEVSCVLNPGMLRMWKSGFWNKKLLTLQFSEELVHGLKWKGMNLFTNVSKENSEKIKSWCLDYLWKKEPFCKILGAQKMRWRLLQARCVETAISQKLKTLQSSKFWHQSKKPCILQVSKILSREVKFWRIIDEYNTIRVKVFKKPKRLHM